jgi:hypothetical protein
MRISAQELERLIKEELQEALEQYPADAMAEITATIFGLADKAGVPTTGDQREAMVGEIEELLRGQGFELREQGLIFAEPLSINLGGTQLGDLMLDIRDALPGAWNQMIKAFERGGIDLGIPLEPEEDEEDQTDTVVVPPVEPPPEEPPEEEIEELQVGDIIDVSEEFGTKAAKKHLLRRMLKPGTSYRVDSVDYDEKAPLVIVNVETDRSIGGLRHEDFLDYPEFFTIRQGDDEEELTQTIVVPPVDPPDDEEEEDSFENPWKFKWFWEEGALDDLEDDREDSEVVRNLMSIPSGKDITIATLVGLAGTAGLYALWKYLFGAEDDEDLPPGLAQSVAEQAEQLEALSGIDVQDPETIVSVIKWVLSLTLDEGQMEWVNRIEPIIRALAQDEGSTMSGPEFSQVLSSLLDEVPGIELIDKLPGGREKALELMYNKWEIMDQKERIDLILMLAPEEYLEMLDQILKASPRMSEIPGMDFPGVKAGLKDWLNKEYKMDEFQVFDPPVWAFLLLAGGRLGLLDPGQAMRLWDLINQVDVSLEESKEDGKVKRGMKLMKMLLQEQQLNRMKVLAGVR